MEEFVEFGGFYAENGGFFVDHALFEHLHGHANLCAAGTFAAAGLKHPQLTVLYGELYVLHVLEIVFQVVLYVEQLLVNRRHNLFQ